MNTKIKRYARFLEIFCKFIVIPLDIFSFFYVWFSGATISESNLWAGFGYSWDSMESLTNIPLISKTLGMLVDGVSYVLFFVGMFYFLKILKLFQHGDVFSLKILQLFSNISKVALTWALYQPVKQTLLSIVTTFWNPVGQRMISVSLSSADINNIFIVVFLFVIVSLMHEAYALKSESDLTV